MPNGYLPAGQLVVVEDNDQLIPTAAAAFVAMRTAARAAGRTISIAEPAGAYRSYAVQVDMRARPWLYNLNPASTASLARPGFSGHGDGNCIDIIGDLAWVIANGARFGWTRPLSNDPNHFRHDGVTAISGGGSIGGTPSKEDPMIPIFYIADSNNATVTVGKGDIWVRTEPGVPLRRLTQGQATDYFTLLGLDFSSPNVKSKPGTWFDAAFAEDKVVHEFSVGLTHPYLDDVDVRGGTTGGGSVDLTPILNAIAAGEAQDAKDVAAVLAKLDGVDEATAATLAARLVKA